MKNCKKLPVIVLMLLTATLTTTSNYASIALIDNSRQVSPFEKLELEGAFEIMLIQGDEESVFIDAPSDVNKEILTKVEGGTLHIYTEKGFKSKAKIAITVYFKNLREIDCSGAIDLTGMGPMKFETLLVDASGACKIKMELTASKLNVDISGAGNTTLSGKVNTVSLDISGAGKYMASNLVADSYDIDVSGTGNAEINAAKQLGVEVSGTGNVRYSGDPKITKDISGTGQVSKM